MAQPLLPAARHLDGFSYLILGRPLAPYDDSSINLFWQWHLGIYIKLLGDMGFKDYKDEAKTNSFILGFSAKEQSVFVQKILRHSGSEPLRQDIINGVYELVHGIPARPDQLTYWSDLLKKNYTYTSMLNANIKWYNEHEDERRKAVHNAYQYGMGRPATEGVQSEMAYWLPLKKYGSIMKAAQAPWLYNNPDGLIELNKTVDRLFTAKNGKYLGNKPVATAKSDFLKHIKQFQVPYADMLWYYDMYFHPIG